MFNKKYSSYVYLFLIFSFCALSYSNTFKAPFVFDDERNIVNNAHIQSFENLLTASKKEKTHKTLYDLETMMNSRIVAYISFFINYKFHGLNVIGYHILNLLIHLMCILFYYKTLSLIFETNTKFHDFKAQDEKAKKIVFLSALLFALHPVQTMSVTYIIQRMTSLAALFFILSFFAYIKSRNSKEKYLKFLYYFASLVFAILAMKTKEISFFLPMVILLYEFIFIRDSLRNRVKYIVPIFLTLFIIPFSMINLEGSFNEIFSNINQATRLDDTGLSRENYLFTQFRVIITYLRLFFLPINQNIDYDYPIFRNFFHPDVFISFLFLSALFFSVSYALYISFKTKDKHKSFYLKLISFGFYWFVLTLSVESSIFPIKDVIFEHRLYLPSMGFFFCFSSLLFYLYFSNKNKNYAKQFNILFASLLIMLSLLTFIRNNTWSSGVSLWLDAAQKSPQKARPLCNLGALYQKEGNKKKALDAWLSAYNIDVNHLETLNNLGALYLSEKQFPKAEFFLQKSHSLSPKHISTLINLGILYEEAGSSISIFYFRLALDNAVLSHKHLISGLKNKILNLEKKYSTEENTKGTLKTGR